MIPAALAPATPREAPTASPRPRTPRPATAPPEARGLARDAVRLLVSGPSGHRHATFRDLPGYLPPGTLLVVNDSATLPASLPAVGADGPFRLNLSTRFGARLWLAEPRRSAARPGPLPIRPGDRFESAGVAVRAVAPCPGRERLWFVAFAGDVDGAMRRSGEPIRYGYLEPPFPDLPAYQTVFAKTPGSAEMPSAARPFTTGVIDALRRGGVELAPITLHAGVSSLEIDGTEEDLPPEPFHVPAPTAAAVNAARRDGRLVVAVGTTVVRALESARDGEGVRAAAGFTRLLVRPDGPVPVADGILTGLHEPRASHRLLLEAVAGQARLADAYREAEEEGYRWHEFGDTHLILPTDVPFVPAPVGCGDLGSPEPSIPASPRRPADRVGDGPALRITL